MKKRICSLLSALALIIALLPITNALADVKTYDITVAGVQVTSENASDILGDGAFSYDALMNVLTVWGDCEYYGEGALIDIRVPNQIIDVPEIVKLTSDGDVIATNQDLTITGPGKLELNSFDGCGIFVYGGASLTLDGLELYSGGSFGIMGYVNEESLFIRYSRLSVSGIGGAVFGFEGGISMEGCVVTRPEGGWVSDSAIVDKNGDISGEIFVEEPGDSGPVNPFEDVSEMDDYYFEVIWAYYAEPQVTSGTDKTHFSPNATVTRGQAVTFLWRAMGEPEPTAKVNPFADVSETAYYYKPVLCAVEKGITSGTDATHFTPDQTCSTAHIVTFLYRTMGVGTDGWYDAAARWAQSSGLLDGLTLEVTLGADCSRADVVQLLYGSLRNS